MKYILICVMVFELIGCGSKSTDEVPPRIFTAKSMYPTANIYSTEFHNLFIVIDSIDAKGLFITEEGNITKVMRLTKIQ